MWSRKFWKDLTERVVASAAGGALAVLTVGQTSWQAIAVGAGVAAAVSLLKGLIAAQKGDPASASLVE